MRFQGAAGPFPTQPFQKDPMLSHGLCIPTEQGETLSESSVSASSPSHTDMTFDQADPTASKQRSFRFYPPRCYQASLAGTSSLLRVHLPPRTRLNLEFPLDRTALLTSLCKASPVKVWLPVSNPILKHATGLTEYRMSPSTQANRPCCAESGLLVLCVTHFLWLP